MAADYFLKLDGIAGESQDSAHKGEIDIESFSFSETNAAEHERGGSSAGKVAMGDINLMASMSKASPALFLACATGQHIKTATIAGRKAGKTQQEYLKITLSDVFVSSYQISGSASAVTPMESFSINYSKIEFEYKEQKADGTLGGSVKKGFDVKALKAT